MASFSGTDEAAAAWMEPLLLHPPLLAPLTTEDGGQVFLASG